LFFGDKEEGGCRVKPGMTKDGWMDANAMSGPSWRKAAAGFALMFILYQAAEGLQTVFLPGSPIGPALMLASLVIAWPIGRWLGGSGYDRFGLGLTRGWWAVLAGGMLLAVTAKLASLAVGSGLGVYLPSGLAAPLTLAAIAITMVTTFVPSLAEDILTRGFLLRAIPVRLGFFAYVVGSALLYTANHIWRLDWGLSEQLRLFCLGLAYGAAAWRWRSLWGAVALHWGWNLSNALVDQAISFDAADVVASRMLTAGAHLALLAIVLLWAPRRRRDLNV
jgi:membrane protease YdiL (CAAX protease family)